MTDEIQLNADTSGATRAFQNTRQSVEDLTRALGLNEKQGQRVSAQFERMAASAVAASMKNAQASQQSAAAGRQNAASMEAQANAARRLAEEERKVFAALNLARNAGGRVINSETGQFASKAQISQANNLLALSQRHGDELQKQAALERQRAINAQTTFAAEQRNLNIAREQTSEYKKRQAELSKAFAGNVIGLASPDATRWERLRNVLGQIPPTTWGTRIAAANDALLGMSNSARYALYSVAGGAAVAGAAIGGFGVVSIKAAIEHERAFANVERTTQTTTEGYLQLQRQLEIMSMEIPVTYEELTKIATAAGQLGIEASGVEKFTRTVAMLTATTNLTSDAAGNALARFKAFFSTADDPRMAVTERTMDNLASSILAVGVNSIATESGIVNVSTQISSMGKYAGLTANQVIGLAGALSSVGVAPELARGITTRLFTIMGDAVSASGVQLEKFARLSGVSATEFSDAWGSDRFAGVFTSFLAGLNKVSENGGDANDALRELGITAVRDRPVWLRLASAAGENAVAGSLLAQTLRDAERGWRMNTELAIQYAKISTTTSARLQVMAQAFEQLFAAMGEESAGFVGELAVAITSVVRGFEEFAQSDAGKVLGTIAAQGALVVGGLLLVVGALAGTAATAQGVGTAFREMTAAGVAGSARLTAAFRILTLASGLVGLVTTLAITVGTFLAMGAAADKAASPIQDMGSLLEAMKADAEAGAEGITFWGRQSGAAAAEAEGTAKQAANMAEALYGVDASGDDATSSLHGVAQAAKDVKYVFGDTAKDVYKNQLLMSEGFQKLFGESYIDDDTGKIDLNLIDYDKIITESTRKGGDVGKAVRKAIEEQMGTSVDWEGPHQNADAATKSARKVALDLTEIFRNTSGDIQGQIDATNALATATSYSVNSMVDDYELLDDVTQKTVDKIAAGFEKFTDTGSLIGLTQKFVSGEEGAAEAFEAAWSDAYGGTAFSIDAYMQVFRRAAGEQQTFIENLQQLGERGLDTAIIEELSAMGPQAASLVEALMNGTQAQLEEYELLWGQTGYDSMVKFATQAAIGQAIVNNVMAAGGIEALRQFNASLSSGVGVEQALADLQLDVNGKPITPKVNAPGTIPDIPFAEREGWRARNGIMLPVTPYLTKSVIQQQWEPGTTGGATNRLRIAATGGYISGPGTGTSDSIPARLSNGEFVMTAKATRALGVNNLYAMMRSAQGGRSAPRGRGYATGGLVGNNSSPGANTTGVVHLSVEDRSLLMLIADRVGLRITEQAIAGATNAANAANSQRRSS